MNLRRMIASSSSTCAVPRRGFSLLAAAAHHAQTQPTRTAVIDDAGAHSYARVVAAIGIVAHRLRDALPERRLGPPPVVASLLPRSVLHAVAQHATWAAGATHLPMVPQLTREELRHRLTDARADAIIVHPTLVDLVKDLSLARILNYDHDDVHAAEQQSPPDLLSLSPIFEHHHTYKDSPAMILYTSGTTGKPKGVVTTFSNIEAQVSTLIDAWRWSSSDRIQLLLPLHHVHGIINVLNCALFAGATVETSDKGFNASATWERWMSSSEPPLTLSMAVPTIYAKMISAYDEMKDPAMQERARKAAAGFRLMVSGSAALPTPVFDRWESITGHRLLERYGMTEIGMALGNPYDGPRVKGSVGVPFPGVEARIDPADGQLLIRGPQVFKCYLNRPDATAETFTEDGVWFKTGDVAAVDEGSGYYSILGRASVDIIKSGGHKISALVIEREILSHEAVVEVAVVGVPDDVYGETVAAVIVLKDQRELDSVKELIKTRVAKWEVPRIWKIVDSIPRNALGKVNKKDLIKRMFAART